MLPLNENPLHSRFADRLKLDPETGCHLWIGYKDIDGYGRISRGRGVKVGAHRLAWELASGRKIPPGLAVLHKCDRPNCCNPEHLEVSTHGENMRQRQARDRQAKGSRNGRSKTNEAQVSAVKRVIADGTIPHARLARLMGVSHSTLRDIAAGKTWRHVDPE